MKRIAFILGAGLLLGAASCQQGAPDASVPRAGTEVVELPAIVVERMTRDEWAQLGMPHGADDAASEELEELIAETLPTEPIAAVSPQGN